MGAQDIISGSLNRNRYARAAVETIRDMEAVTRGLISTPFELAFWDYHMKTHHRYLLIAPRAVSFFGPKVVPEGHLNGHAEGEEPRYDTCQVRVLQDLEENVERLAISRIMFCDTSLGSSFVLDPWTLVGYQQRAFNKNMWEGVFRLVCQNCSLHAHYSTERLLAFSRHSLESPYFCSHFPLQGAEVREEDH